MISRWYFHLLILLFMITVKTKAQSELGPFLNIGGSAPPIRVREWLKGEPIQQFEKGKVYVLEFWATWCKPCIAAMPHLSSLAVKYKDKVTFLGIDVYENKMISINERKAFVDSLGKSIDFNVGVEDSNFMVTSWFNSFGESGIPKSFVVDIEGRIAWIGHPKDLNNVLTKVTNHTWDIKEALAERNLNKRLEEQDDSLNSELNKYGGDETKNDYIGKPDSALLLIQQAIEKEPGLKYMPCIAVHTFSSLLKVNPHQAYKYGKEVMLQSKSDDNMSLYLITEAVRVYSGTLKIPIEIYNFSAEAYQVRIDNITYPETVNISKLYARMAECYWLGNNKSKAINAQQKAIAAIKKSKNFFSASEMAALESKLKQYKNIKLKN